MKFSEANPDQVGIGIDEETALVVKGHRAEVVGLGTVSIYDRGRNATANPVVLRSGDSHDFAARK